MAFTFSAQYAPDVENCMRGFYQTLSEKDQRRFAALEANRLGFGGIQYIAKVLGCSRRTIERAAEEIQALPHDPAAGRVRRPGGGRKKKSPATRNSKTT
jgi:transcriptional antiterminator